MQRPQRSLVQSASDAIIPNAKRTIDAEPTVTGTQYVTRSRRGTPEIQGAAIDEPSCRRRGSLVSI